MFRISQLIYTIDDAKQKAWFAVLQSYRFSNRFIILTHNLLPTVWAYDQKHFI